MIAMKDLKEALGEQVTALIISFLFFLGKEAFSF